MLKKRIRHIQRYRDIVYAFTRYGFGYVMKELGVFELLSIPKKVFTEGNKVMHSMTTGERIRLFLEELGPTFIKMGQIASTRPDVIPADIIKELVKLQDQVPLFSFEEVRQIIEQELAGALEATFAEFSEIPLAAASIGQVHAARLLTGERVAVKIQRPRIDQLIQTDLEILQDLARLAESRIEWAERYQLRDIVDELADSIRQELDYKTEGRNAERLAKQFKNNAKVVIPKIFWEFTSSKVLTMQYIEGVKLNEADKLHEQGYSSKALAENVVQSIFQQILIEGFFHGDPHPGNILALPGDAIAFMDFGIIGRLSPEMRQHVTSFVIAMMNQDSDEVVRTLTNMGLVPDSVNRDKLRADVDVLREKYSHLPFSEMSLGKAVNELFSVAFRHRIKLPTDLTILGKTLLTMEGVVEKLDPDLSIIKIAEPFGRQLVKERFHPKHMAGKMWGQFFEYGEILDELPQTVKEITNIMKKGKMKLEVTTPELDIFVKKLNRISNRLSFSIVLLSFSIVMVGVIVGASISGQSSILLTKIPVIEIGFVIATFMFLWLLFSIFRSGRF